MHAMQQPFSSFPVVDVYAACSVWLGREFFLRQYSFRDAKGGNVHRTIATFRGDDSLRCSPRLHFTPASRRFLLGPE